MEGVVQPGVKLRILAQNHEIAAVALSGIDEVRTVSNVLYTLQIFSNPPGLVTSVVTDIETSKRWQANPSQTSENELF
jgi:hypothetical protein